MPILNNVSPGGAFIHTSAEKKISGFHTIGKDAKRNGSSQIIKTHRMMAHESGSLCASRKNPQPNKISLLCYKIPATIAPLNYMLCLQQRIIDVEVLLFFANEHGAHGAQRCAAEVGFPKGNIRFCLPLNVCRIHSSLRAGPPSNHICFNLLGYLSFAFPPVFFRAVCAFRLLAGAIFLHVIWRWSARLPLFTAITAWIYDNHCSFSLFHVQFARRCRYFQHTHTQTHTSNGLTLLISSSLSSTCLSRLPLVGWNDCKYYMIAMSSYKRSKIYIQNVIVHGVERGKKPPKCQRERWGSGGWKRKFISL